MLNWIRNRLSREEPEEEIEEFSKEVEEEFNPVGVRVNPPPVTVKLRPADTYIAGYNVDMAEDNTGHSQSEPLPLIRTTGVDPYNTGRFVQSDAKKAVREK